MSYEKFMLDADFCGALHTYLRGVVVDDEQLALDAYTEVEPAGHFFGCKHTLRHYESAFWESELADARPWESWAEAGSSNAMDRANARWKQVLADYTAPPMDAGMDAALQEFIVDRKAGVPDMWH